jgi:hypothetical protein
MHNTTQIKSRQLDLFDGPPAAATATDEDGQSRRKRRCRRVAPTSLNAYDEARSRFSERAHQVLVFIRGESARGATNHELHQRLAIPYTGVPAITGKLRDAGAIRDSGRTRPTPHGREAIVWLATEEAS